MKWWHWLIAALAACALSYAAGRYLAPTKTVEVESSKQAEQIKSLTEQLETAKRHTIKKTVIKYADSGKPAEKVVTEDTHVDRTTDTRTDAHATKTVEVIKTVTVERSPAMNRVSAMAAFDFKSQSVLYGVQYQRRLFGPVGAGVFALSDVRTGVGVGASLFLEF